MSKKKKKVSKRYLHQVLREALAKDYGDVGFALYMFDNGILHVRVGLECGAQPDFVYASRWSARHRLQQKLSVNEVVVSVFGRKEMCVFAVSNDEWRTVRLRPLGCYEAMIHGALREAVTAIATRTASGILDLQGKTNADGSVTVSSDVVARWKLRAQKGTHLTVAERCQIETDVQDIIDAINIRDGLECREVL